MITVKVNASKSYDIHIGEGLLQQAGGMIAGACGGSKALIVADSITGALFGDEAEYSLRAAGYETARFTFPHGERSKNTDTLLALLHAMAEANLTRTDAAVSLGGGVAGDIAGFAAAIYLRGIRLAHIPTTLLAMVDSSVGGKTAVDLASGKNQIGAFYQPDAVICDTRTLRTLPGDVYADGCAEMIKHGIILSRELFGLLKLPLDAQMDDIIARNVTIKRDVVEKDEKDTGIRMLLNFGHTIGHGIEKYSGYAVSHGKAVAAGIASAARGAYKSGVCAESCYAEIVDMLNLYGLPDRTDIPADLLIEASLYDKKRGGGIIKEILPEEIGKCVIKDFTLEEYAGFIRLAIE